MTKREFRWGETPINFAEHDLALQGNARHTQAATIRFHRVPYSCQHCARNSIHNSNETVSSAMAAKRVDVHHHFVPPFYAQGK